MGELEEPTAVVNLKAPPVYIVIIIQFFTSVIAALGAFALLGTVAAYSVLLGGLICTISNGYFAKKAFMYVGARASPKIIKALYSGEAIKLLLIFAGFGLVMVYVKPINILAFFLGFLGVHIAGLITLTYVLKN